MDSASPISQYSATRVAAHSRTRGGQNKPTHKIFWVNIKVGWLDHSLHLFLRRQHNKTPPAYFGYLIYSWVGTNIGLENCLKWRLPLL